MRRPCSSINSKAIQSSLYGENIKRNNEPIYDNKHLIFKFLVMSEVWYNIMQYNFSQTSGTSVRTLLYSSDIALCAFHVPTTKNLIERVHFLII
jgi:hypothetical protein